MKLIKNTVEYKLVELWKVKLQDQFTINVVWLKDVNGAAKVCALDKIVID